MNNVFRIQIAVLTATSLLMGCNRDESRTKNHPSEVSEEVSVNFEDLKPLDWLKGEWTENEPDIDLKISYNWDKNKNFFIQHFDLKDGENESLEGKQYIGWDPIESRIRSWIFDSDGGFGEGIWYVEGDRVYSNMKFTLADGRSASATHIYTKIDNDTYTFTSENRDIDGEMLPNIGPFKVIRK